MVSSDFFSSLMMLCYCVLHVLRHSVHWNCCTEEMRSLLGLLEVEGSLARIHRFNSWNLKEASHESFVFVSSTSGIWRKFRTQASFQHIQLLEFEGSLARIHRFNSWTLKEASHESFFFVSSTSGLKEVSHASFVSTYSTLGIWRKPRTNSSLQLLEFEGSPRKLRFRLFN